MRKFIVILLALTLVFQLGAVSASAADYTYTVRVFAGNRGDISGGSMVTYSGLAYGETVSFDLSRVTVNDARYYVQGIRHSGRDNDALQPTTITVTEDVDYVVAYGIAGNLVPYTVNYRSEGGATLAPSQTYYGNIGDKPVIAFLYIDGYVPQAYNLTKTLSENAAENVFTFTYTPLVITVVENNTAVIPDDEDADAGDGGQDGGNAQGDEAQGGDQNDGDTQNGEPLPDDNAPEEDVQGGGNAAPVEIPDNETPLSDGPPELIDLDENDTPMANFVEPDAEKKTGSGVMLALSIGILCAAVGGLAVPLVLWLKKRRKNKQEEATAT